MNKINQLNFSRQKVQLESGSIPQKRSLSISPFYPESVRDGPLFEPVPSVQTRLIGYAPILKFFMERCQLISLIDRHVPCDPRRTGLTHGEACVAMITGIFHQVFPLDAISKFATATDILQVILPHIPPDAYFDDRLGDTLDAIYNAGLGDLELILTRHMLKECTITVNSLHDDTTTAGAFPLFQQAYDGNTTDVNTYLEQWQYLIELLGHRDFLFVADSKLLSKENMAFLHPHEGRFLASVSMYASYKTWVEEALANHAAEALLPYKQRLNRGFEVACPITHEDETYDFRLLIFYDAELFARRNQSLAHRLTQTTAALEALRGKLNRYQLKT
ncbi:transposase, IS4 family [Candidatus Vecturithrix granuli]|uniref:Transposase, IS4 family n=1 Tax=Vecturithrix granuli TaxID=1499967 RepID=A0A081C6Q5_VECG1|nr:transposase, IS4 family [Candidatus Vecturithrix granuli]